MDAITWIFLAVSFVLAVAPPIQAWRRASRTEVVRELWLYSKPGRIVTGRVALIVLLLLAGALCLLFVQTFPFLWGTIALTGGGLVATAINLARFLAFDPVEEFSPKVETSTE